jgi:hypothetical protein
MYEIYYFFVSLIFFVENRHLDSIMVIISWKEDALLFLEFVTAANNCSGCFEF